MCKVFASACVHCIVGLLGNDSDMMEAVIDLLSRVHNIQILSVSLDSMLWLLLPFQIKTKQHE